MDTNFVRALYFSPTYTTRTVVETIAQAIRQKLEEECGDDIFYKSINVTTPAMRKAQGDLQFSKDEIVVFGVPHAFPIEDFDVESVAVTDGPRLVEPLKELGYTHVVAELDAHSKTLGTDEIVFSDFGGMIRSAIGWLNE